MLTDDQITDRVQHMSVQAVDIKPITIDWREAAGQDLDGWQFWQSFTYEVDEDREVLLIAKGPGALVSHLYADGALYGEYDWDDYESAHTDEDGNLWPGALDEGEFEELFRVEPYYHGAEGPMMNYWYPLDESADGYFTRFDPQVAAGQIADTALCVVEVDGNYGLALTGGGMDLSWDICEAFVALDILPPTHFADLPRFAGASATDSARLVLAGMERALIWQQDWLGYRLKRLRELRTDLQEGRL